MSRRLSGAGRLQSRPSEAIRRSQVRPWSENRTNSIATRVSIFAHQVQSAPRRTRDINLSGLARGGQRRMMAASPEGQMGPTVASGPQFERDARGPGNRE